MYTIFTFMKSIIGSECNCKIFVWLQEYCVFKLNESIET